MGEVVVSSEGEIDVEKDGKKEAEKNGSAKVFRWERLLPRMVVRVLLVEADDSTSQIIAALLRKCSYRVAAVPDGLMAWETLKSRPHNIDLVLTEVELPSISGFALLTLVVEHDICKNIPVIMMSSHDSISMVLNCMLKGAADFLVKPVRRNELRNLWQHVWRRHSLLGGHIRQNIPIVQCKHEAISENNAASNHSSDYAASMQKTKDSEKESEAQCSCTSPYLEAESDMQNMQGLSQLKCTSASNICDANMEKQDKSVKMETKTKMPESKTAEVPDELLVSEKLNRSGPEFAPCNDAFRLEEVCACAKTMPKGETMGLENDRRSTNLTSGIHSCSGLIEPSGGAIDLIGTFDNHLKFPDRLSTANGGMDNFDFAPQLELSLRKFFPSKLKDQGKNERHTLNHSTASAFCWYNSSKTFPNSASKFSELKDGTSKSHQPLSNKISGNAIGCSPPCGATSSNNPESMTSLAIGQSGQTGLTLPRPHRGFIPIPDVRFDNICAGYSHVFPHILYTQSGLPSSWSPKSSRQRESSPFPVCTSVQSNPEIHDSQQGYQCSGEFTNNSIKQTAHEQNELERLQEWRHGSPAADQSAKSSLCNGLSNNNSSGMYGGVFSRIDRNASAKEIEKGLAPENLNEGTLFIQDGFRGLKSHCSGQREAALTKFRLKRKDRCYEKKVRYRSRKSLAEQRPRVKGQFVCQVRTDVEVANADGCP